MHDFCVIVTWICKRAWMRCGDTIMILLTIVCSLS